MFHEYPCSKNWQHPSFHFTIFGVSCLEIILACVSFTPRGNTDTFAETIIWKDYDIVSIPVPDFLDIHARNFISQLYNFAFTLFHLPVLVSHTKAAKAYLQKYIFLQRTRLCQKSLVILSQHKICPSLSPEKMQISIVHLQVLLHCTVL